MTPPNPVKSQKTGIRVLTCDTDRVLILLKGKAPQNDPYYFRKTILITFPTSWIMVQQVKSAWHLCQEQGLRMIFIENLRLVWVPASGSQSFSFFLQSATNPKT